MPRSKELVEGLCNLLKQCLTCGSLTPQRILLERDCKVLCFLLWTVSSGGRTRMATPPAAELTVSLTPKPPGLQGQR